jgi:ABC-type transporter Mla MlaB component
VRNPTLVPFGMRRRVALESLRMTYRIHRSASAHGVTFFLSGEVDSSHVAGLETLMAAESKGLVSLDLSDVTLVNRDAIKFLAGVEGARAVLINCPEYVRSWIDAEQSGA